MMLQTPGGMQRSRLMRISQHILSHHLLPHQQSIRPWRRSPRSVKLANTPTKACAMGIAARCLLNSITARALNSLFVSKSKHVGSDSLTGSTYSAVAVRCDLEAKKSSTGFSLTVIDMLVVVGYSSTFIDKTDISSLVPLAALIETLREICLSLRPLKPIIGHLLKTTLL